MGLAACKHHIFDLKRTAVSNAGPTFYDNVTMSSDYNFVYTIPMEIGTPAQTGEIMVDINYPGTIIWGKQTT